jgi:hypothetical protein
MKKLTQQLLQYIRHNQQQQMHHRRQLVRQCQSKSHVREQQQKLIISDVMSGNDSSGPEKVYHQGNRKYDVLRRNWYDMIAASEPTHFLTVQFPKNMRSPSLKVSKDNLRQLMARFEQCLIGSRWAKSHLPFYAFAEIGPEDGYNYHFHILFNAGSYNTEQIQNALDNACLQLSLSFETFYLENVETYETIYYCLKDAKITNCIDGCDTIMFSSDLFNI